MGRGALLTGTAGGIIGTIAAGIGIIWFILIAFQSYQLIPIIVGSIMIALPFYTGVSMIIIVFTILFVALLAVSSILTGVGFYGEYTVSQKAMGVVGLVFGIIGGVSAAILIIIGLFTNPSIGFLQNYASNSLIINWIAFIILGVSFIIMGSASIVMGDFTTKPGAAKAGGILGIIGGSAFILYILGLTIIIGSGLVFTAFLLWAIVFYGTEA
ncbi:MAG: hypothetical protein WED07_13010 [Candidatus Freyarchaeum deiterrae]